MSNGVCGTCVGIGPTFWSLMSGCQPPIAGIPSRVVGAGAGDDSPRAVFATGWPGVSHVSSDRNLSSRLLVSSPPAFPSSRKALPTDCPSTPSNWIGPVPGLAGPVDPVGVLDDAVALLRFLQSRRSPSDCDTAFVGKRSCVGDNPRPAGLFGSAGPSGAFAVRDIGA